MDDRVFERFQGSVGYGTSFSLAARKYLTIKDGNGLNRVFFMRRHKFTHVSYGLLLVSGIPGYFQEGRAPT